MPRDSELRLLLQLILASPRPIEGFVLERIQEMARSCLERMAEAAYDETHPPRVERA